jgi:hypothetical protein
MVSRSSETGTAEENKMAKLIKLETTKTYATEQNAIKAVENFLGDRKDFKGNEFRYMVLKTEDNRYYPAFLGEAAVQAGIHFRFHVVM